MVFSAAERRSKVRIPPLCNSKMKRSESGGRAGEDALSLVGQKSLRGVVFALGLWT